MSCLIEKAGGETGEVLRISGQSFRLSRTMHVHVSYLSDGDLEPSPQSPDTVKRCVQRSQAFRKDPLEGTPKPTTIRVTYTSSTICLYT